MPPLDSLVSLSITLIGLSAMPNSMVFRRICVLALIAYQTYVIYRPNPLTTQKFHLYQNSLLIILNTINYLDHAIINNASQSHKRKGQTVPLVQMSFFQRLKWSADIMLTNRGINWSWEIPHLRRLTQSRWLFIRNKFFHILTCILVSDVLRFLRAENPAWQVDTDEGFGSRGFIWQIYNVVIFWSSTASMQLFGYSLLSLVTVALVVYDPNDWPEFYGRLSDAKSIRFFWG